MAKGINLSMGCPLPQYIKDGGGGGRPRKRVRPGCGVLLGLQVLVGVHQEGREGEGRRGRGEGKGGQPFFPSPIRTRGEGGAASPCGPSPLPTKAHQGPLLPCNYPVLRKIPESLGTFPMSEYSLPIYESLRLDHFETPRHVPDLIRDSELPSVHQNT